VTTVFLSSWVLPVVDLPIRDGFVAVRDGRIVALGPTHERPRASDAGGAVREVELGHGAILPGFVNAHTHLELTHLRGAVTAEAGFVPWIEKQLSARATAGDGPVGPAIQEAIHDLHHAATAAVADVSNSLASVAPLVESRLHAVVAHEILGWDPERAEAIVEATARSRAVAEELAARTAGRIRVEGAAHAPHSLSPVLIERLFQARPPRSIHLAESRDEVDFLRDGSGPWSSFLDRRVGQVPFTPPNLSPVEYARRKNLLGPGTLAVHCVHVSEADIAGLLDSGAVAVLCPRSNEFLGHGLPPAKALHDAGVPLALGTDSLASCDSLNVLDDARRLAAVVPEVEPRVWIEAMTLGGARALGFERIGRLVPGADAALAFVPIDPSSAGRPPERSVLSSEAPSRSVQAPEPASAEERT
jgi:cytosine/adenosine deaminase-related metal-dependent hydrolase